MTPMTDITAPNAYTEDSLSSPEDEPPRSFNSGNGSSGPEVKPRGVFSKLKSKIFKSSDKTDNTLREVIEEYIVEPESFNTDSVSTHERVLLSNILKLRDISVFDIMVPRADILAIDVDIPKEELFALLADQQYSRLPVYKDNLDDVLGTVHIKDILSCLCQNKDVNLNEMITEVPIVSPSMPILDLVLKMRHTKRHLAMIVDEYGGIDGIVTMGDVIQAIIGEVDDEHDNPEENVQMLESSDGALLADARVEIKDFEDIYGSVFEDDERDESDTLGGVVSDLAGRVPARGEVLAHPSGMLFEIVEADPRRIHRLKISQIPPNPDEQDDSEAS